MGGGDDDIQTEERLRIGAPDIGATHIVGVRELAVIQTFALTLTHLHTHGLLSPLAIINRDQNIYCTSFHLYCLIMTQSSRTYLQLRTFTVFFCLHLRGLRLDVRFAHMCNGPCA